MSFFSGMASRVTSVADTMGSSITKVGSVVKKIGGKDSGSDSEFDPEADAV